MFDELVALLGRRVHEGRGDCVSFWRLAFQLSRTSISASSFKEREETSNEECKMANATREKRENTFFKSILTMMGKRERIWYKFHTEKYHYTEIIFTNSFEVGQKAIQKDKYKKLYKNSQKVSVKHGFKKLNPFGNVVLVTSFVFFGKTCEWKSVWKYM